MLNAKRLMSVVLILAMLVTMASFPVSADTETAVVPADLTFVGGEMTGSNGSNKAANAVDGDYSTYYVSDQYNNNTAIDLIFELETPGTLDTLKIQWGHNGWGNMGVNKYNVAVSEDNVTYTTIREYDDLYNKPTTYKDTYGDDITYSGTSGAGSFKAIVEAKGLNLENVKYIKIEIRNFKLRPTIAEIEAGIAVPPAEYTVEWIDEDGNPLQEKELKVNADGSTVTETAKSFKGYEVVGDSEKSVLLDKNEVKSIVFTYKKRPDATYTVNYVDAEGNPIADAKVVAVGEYFEGDVVKETSADVPGYKAALENQEITLVAGENVITFEYEKLPDFNYTVKYVDEEGNPLVPETTGVAVYPYEVTIETPYVNGYYRPATITKTIAADGEVVEIVYEALPEKMMPTPDDLLGDATVSSPRCDNNSVSNPDHLLDDDNKTCLNACWGENITITVDLHGQYDISDIGLLWCGGSKTANYDKLPTGKQMPGGLRATKYTISVSTDGTTYVPVYTYEDSNRTDSRDTITVKDFTVTPKGVRYVKITTAGSFTTAGRITLFDIDINGYVVTDRVSYAPPYQYYAKGSESVTFPITVMTLENVKPSFFADKANWTLENATIDGDIVINNVSDPDSDYYTWEFNVKVVPTDNEKEFSLKIDLPDSYVLQDELSFKREPSNLLFDATIADGDNKIDLSKTKITLEYEKEELKTKPEDRTVMVEINVQSIIPNVIYMGYDDVVIEVVELASMGNRAEFDLKTGFVRVGNVYYGSMLINREGAEKLKATVVLYGINGDGSKTELDRKTIYSDDIIIDLPVVNIKTDAQKVAGHTLSIDVIDQLFDQVSPFDLPARDGAEWNFYEEVLIARGASKEAAKAEIERLITKIEELQAAASEPDWPAPDYPDSVTIVTGRWKWNNGERVGYDVNDTSHYERNFYFSADLWNLMKRLHVESFSVETKIENAEKSMRPNESVVEKLYLTFRNGIDYDPKVNWISGTFNVRTQFIATTDAYSTNDETFLARGYNAFRRALNDDQVMPLMFRLGWYNWPSKSNPNPFSGGVYTAVIPETWLDNNGSYNLAVYRMSGYSYKKDNDPTLQLMADDLHVANHVKREVSFEVKGDDKLYETYVIVGTDKLPSELPETLAIYYDVE